MIGVIAKLKIAAGKEAAFEAAAKDLMAKVKANEPGALTYQLYKSKTEADIYIFMEEYSSQAALDAHGKTEYFLAAGPHIGVCLAGPPEVEYFDMVE